MTVEQFILLCSPTEVARLTGIPVRTLQNWRKQVKDFGELNAMTRTYKQFIEGLKRTGITLN